MQHLDLSEDEAAALINELRTTIGNDRYPFSERIRTLKAILAKLGERQGSWLRLLGRHAFYAVLALAAVLGCPPRMSARY